MQMAPEYGALIMEERELMMPDHAQPMPQVMYIWRAIQLQLQLTSFPPRAVTSRRLEEALRMYFWRSSTEMESGNGVLITGEQGMKTLSPVRPMPVTSI